MRIDQFRYDYLLRFRDQYTGGLSRLLNEGAVFDNAYLERYPTVTAIGHAIWGHSCVKWNRGE
jgi:predicted AlkP superfamily pyrophosphatase or phosphodiesterase